MKNGELKAVHDDDLKELLISLGKYDSVINGEEKCYFCSNVINMENLGAIFPYDDQIVFSCNGEKCSEKLIDLGGE